MVEEEKKIVKSTNDYWDYSVCYCPNPVINELEMCSLCHGKPYKQTTKLKTKVKK